MGCERIGGFSSQFSVKFARSVNHLRLAQWARPKSCSAEHPLSASAAVLHNETCKRIQPWGKRIITFSERNVLFFSSLQLRLTQLLLGSWCSMAHGKLLFLLSLSQTHVNFRYLQHCTVSAECLHFDQVLCAASSLVCFKLIFSLEAF